MDPMPRSTLLRLLESRYDYYSARVVYKRTIQRARLADAEHFSAQETQRFIDALQSSGDQRAEAVAVRLWRHLGLTPDEELLSLDTTAVTPPKRVEAVPQAPPTAQLAAETQIEAPAATLQSEHAKAPEAVEEATSADAPTTTSASTSIQEASAQETPSADDPAQADAAETIEATSSPSSEDAAATPAEEVQVRWTFAEVAVEEGQELRVCGDHAALGQWNPALAPVCVPTEDKRWTVTLSLTPGTVMTFKGVLFSDDAKPVWENIPNRTLEISSNTVEASAAWDGPTQTR